MELFPVEAAIVAYADDLIHRVNGGSSSPAALALWRRFAWRNGSPVRGYEFTPAIVRGAVATLTSELAKDAAR